MKTSMAAKQFHWTSKVSNEADEDEEEKKQNNKKKDEEALHVMMLAPPLKKPLDDDDDNVPTSFKTKLTTIEESESSASSASANQHTILKKKLQAIAAVSRLRLAVAALVKKRANLQHQVVGTLFGHRGGHMQLAFQKDSSSPPVFLVELATPITSLVKEMASGLVRIVLECAKDHENHQIKNSASARLLLEEPVWRTFCNAKKCGFTSRRECGAKELKILKALEPVSMGAGVLPAADHSHGGEGSGDSCNGGDVMYMRANFERVVGSRDSEAFYMMNPDSNGAPELSIYLLRV